MSVPSVEAQQHSSTTSLSLVEHVGKQTNKIKKAQLAVNTILITVEYILYLFAFLYLYQWRVAPAIQLTDYTTWFANRNLFEDYIFLLGIIFIIYSVIVARKGLFQFHSQTSFFDEMVQVGKAIFYSFLIAVGILFLLKTSMTYSRAVIITLAGSIFLVALLTRLTKRIIVMQLKKYKLLTKNVLIIGAGEVGNRVGTFLKNKKVSGYEVVGYVDDFKKGKDILGTFNELEKVIQKYNVNEIYITIPSERKSVYQALAKIRKYGLDIKIIPELFDLVSSTIQIHQAEGYPYIEIVKTPLRGFNLFLKRMVDISLSSIGLLILSPILVLVAILIKLDSKGPVFFKQKRIGKNGVPFYMYKFRSMVVNAEELKKKLAEQNEADGPVFKIKDDPRITKIGKFIRKYSIDELPQLLNVIRGEMSLIGPRPPLGDEVVEYSDHQWRRLDVLPGISGLWQVSGRSDLSFEEWVNLDIYYIENWSILLDIRILFRTIPVVLFGKGAY